MAAFLVARASGDSSFASLTGVIVVDVSDESFATEVLASSTSRPRTESHSGTGSTEQCLEHLQPRATGTGSLDPNRQELPRAGPRAPC
jgi:hypothetical protein